LTLVDASAWIELFRATGSPFHRSLKALLEGEGEIATTEPVAMELLAGAQSTSYLRRTRAALAACRMCAVNGPSDWERAATIYRACRAGGTTPRTQIDCLVAAVAIRVEVPVLTADRDFAAIARHTPLELA
jgi:predicted nucleic acid-binding protein